MVKGVKGKNVAPLKGALQQGVKEEECYYCFVESDGTTGPEWVKVLKKMGFPVEPSAKSVLCSPDFVPTKGQKSVIVIYNLSSLRKISMDPESEELTVPTAEIACLLLKKLKGPELKAMRIEKLAVAHSPISGLGGLLRMLVVCDDAHGRRLSSLSDRGNSKFHGVDGVAYVKKLKEKKR